MLADYWSAPWAAASGLRSTDSRSALVAAHLDGDEDAYADRIAVLQPTFTTTTSTGVRIETGGFAQNIVDITGQVKKDLARAEAIAIPLTLMLLVAVFGSLIVGLLPLLVGVLAMIGTFAVLRVLTALTDVSVFSLNLTIALGLGLGIDYALLVVNRFREELQAGHDVEPALRTTVHTAGRTVLFSAATIAIALAALLAFPMYFLRSFAYAGIAVVVITAAAAVVVLPAAPRLLGHRANVRRFGHRAPQAAVGVWGRIAAAVMRRPVISAVAILALLALMALPMASVAFGLPDDRALPAENSQARRVGDVMRQDVVSRESDALVVTPPSTPRPARTWPPTRRRSPACRTSVGPTRPPERSRARIARRLDGLPLALELVAGHASTRTLGELADLIESPLDVAAGDRDRAPRHRSLRETLRWSVDRLDPAHQRPLRRLGVFAGVFDLAAAAAVIGPLPGPLPGARGAAGLDVEAVVRRLVRDAHIAVDRRGPVLRLRLLRTVRDLALDELTAHGERDAVRRRHREWFAARWCGVPLQDDLIEDVRAGYQDYLEALRSAIEAGDGAITADLMATLGRLWLFTEAFGPGLRWTTLALDSGLLAPACRANVLVTHAALLQQSAGPSVGELIEAAVQELALAGDDIGLAEALALWVVEQYLNGDLEEAARTAARLIDLARDAAPQHLPEALSSFAVTQAALGRLEEANAAAQEAWELVTAAPSATYFVAVVSKIALAHTESRQARRALEVLEDAMAGSGRILGVEPTDTMLINAGWAALACDRSDAGLGYFGQAIAHAPRGSVTLGLAEALLGAACALAADGDQRAGAALASSEVLVAELGTVPSPWQREQVAAARARLTDPQPADPSPGASPGRGPMRSGPCSLPSGPDPRSQAEEVPRDDHPPRHRCPNVSLVPGTALGFPLSGERSLSMQQPPRKQVRSHGSHASAVRRPPPHPPPQRRRHPGPRRSPGRAGRRACRGRRAGRRGHRRS